MDRRTGDGGTPPWVQPFYDKKSLAVGPSGVLDHHRERALALGRLTGRASGRVLELGAGAGGSAVAAAQLGYDVTATELSSVRAGFAVALAAESGTRLKVVEGDFMTVELGTSFDIVVMWNGFGVGDDAFQRSMLRRAHTSWLAEGGVLVLDVFNPTAWARWAGADQVDEETGLRHHLDFDVASCRFIDSWWFDGGDADPLSQSVRCYSPPDLVLLVEGTGLALVDLEYPADTDPGANRFASGPLGESWGYRAVLRSPPVT